MKIDRSTPLRGFENVSVSEILFTFMVDTLKIKCC